MRYGADVNEKDELPFAHIWTLHYGNAEKLYHTACGLPLWLYLAVSMAQLVSFKICEGHPYVGPIAGQSPKSSTQWVHIFSEINILSSHPCTKKQDMKVFLERNGWLEDLFVA